MECDDHLRPVHQRRPHASEQRVTRDRRHHHMRGRRELCQPDQRDQLPLAVPAAATPPTAVKLYSAATGTGTGIFSLTPTIGVTVPANGYARTYTSTLTIALISGP